jgi:hypothetical protein
VRETTPKQIPLSFRVAASAILQRWMLAGGEHVTRQNGVALNAFGAKTVKALSEKFESVPSRCYDNQD